jgi:hypothetical protein
MLYDEPASAEAQRDVLAELTELLLAGGYFRSRLTDLTAFDKVVGGLAWSITASNVDVDVDLFYDEEANIGQKIKLSETIERALRSMGCPAPLQAHQIQGLDYPALFPVVQWLVKRVLATREEFGDQRRSFALHTYAALGYQPLSTASQAPHRSAGRVAALAARFPVVRRLKRVSGAPPRGRGAAACCTLLEYGHRFGVVPAPSAAGAQHPAPLAPARAAGAQAPAGEDGGGDDDDFESNVTSHMAAVADGADGVLSGSQAARLVGLRGGELAAAAARAAAEEDPDGVGARTAALTRQLEAASRALSAEQQRAAAAAAAADEAAARAAAAVAELQAVVDHNARCVSETTALDAKLASSPVDAAAVERVVALLRQVQASKQAESAFKGSCRKRLAELQVAAQAAETAQAAGASDADLEPQELARLAEIEEAHAGDVARLAAARAAAARRALACSLLQRKLDELPARPELAQYERCFVELADTVAAKLSETRRLYAMYNAATDALKLLTTEVQLLNKLRSQYDTVRNADREVRSAFVASMASVATGVQDNLRKANDKAARERAQLAEAAERHAAATARTRAYYAAVKQLQEEMAKVGDPSQ